MTTYSVGDRLPEVEMTASPVQLFRYSAVTWNMHRIHYDRDWATREGHSGLLVHSHLHAANAIRALTSGLGPDWDIANVAYRVLRPAAEGMRLRAVAEITAVEDDGHTLHFSLTELNDAGEACLTGTATARLRKPST